MGSPWEGGVAECKVVFTQAGTGGPRSYNLPWGWEQNLSPNGEIWVAPNSTMTDT